MSRNVEVLREIVATLDDTDAPEWHSALTYALLVLEALERQGVVVATGAPASTCVYGAHLVQEACPDLGEAYGADHVACKPTTAAPSEDSKAGRIRALEDGLSLELAGLRVYGDQFIPQPFVRSMARLERLLHPHKSWCNSEHEGICISDPSEVTP